MFDNKKNEQEKTNAYDDVKDLHKKIHEEMWLLQKTVPFLLDDDGKAYETAKDVMSFMKDTIFSHFAWEEHQVFPIALAVGELEIKQVVRDLQQQHIMAIAKFDIMADFILKHGFSFPDDAIKDKFIDTTKEMIELVLKNAQLEDDKLYPFLEDKQVRLDFKGAGNPFNSSQ